MGSKTVSEEATEADSVEVALKGQLSLDEDDLRKKIALEMAAIEEQPRLEEDEITARMYTDINDTSHSRARRYLNRLAEAGSVKRRKVLHDGQWTMAYKLVVDRSDNV